MNIYNLLEQKVKNLENTEFYTNISLLLQHIKIAYEHFNGGINDNSYYFNDVIYRINQAYEGSLKTAYKHILNKSIENVTTAKIEEKLKKTNIIRESVKTYFTQYRKTFRNPSTHNYNIDYNEVEAYIALNNGQSFLYAFLDQLIEINAYNETHDELVKSKQPSNNLGEEKPFNVKLSQYLSNFSLNLVNNTNKSTNESAIIGSLKAYLEKFAKNIKVSTEYTIKKIKAKPDFIVEYNNEKILIEIKTISKSLKDNSKSLEYMLENSKFNSGIYFIPTHLLNYDVIIKSYKYDNKTIVINNIIPNIKMDGENNK